VGLVYDHRGLSEVMTARPRVAGVLQLILIGYIFGTGSLLEVNLVGVILV
jgi:hypothetical protein